MGQERLFATAEAGLLEATERHRLVAFGDGVTHEGDKYTVIPLKQVATFVTHHLKRYRDVLHPVRLTDPTLGLLHLLEKLEEE